MSEANKEEAAQQEQPQDLQVHVMMPPGLGLYLLQRAVPPVMDDKTSAEHVEFAIRMEKLFREVGTKDIDAVVVLVKTRVDRRLPKLDGDGNPVMQVKTDHTGQALEVDGQPVLEQVFEEDTVRGFELDGGMVGSSDEILAMLMHLTESAQRQAMGISEEPVPEGKTEADRCPGCGGFHGEDDSEISLGGTNPLAAEAASNIPS